MWTVILAAVKSKALPWLLANWQHLGWPLAIAFAMLYFRSCGQLSELQKPKAEQVQAQSLTATAKANSTGSVTVPGRPAMPCPPSKTCPECPDVKLVFGSSAETMLEGTQKQTASIGAEKPMNFRLALGLGAHFGHDTVPKADLLLNYKDLYLNGSWASSGLLSASAMWTLYRGHLP